LPLPLCPLQVYVIGGDAEMYVVDASDPTAPSLLETVSLDGASQSVAVNSDGVVAVAVGIDGSLAAPYSSVTYHDSGKVQLFQRVDGSTQSLASLTVGALPDSLAFSPDGTQIVSANEGEPNTFYGKDPISGVQISSDPPGTISIIDVDTSDYAASVVTTLGFESFTQSDLEADGIRISGDDTMDGVTGNLVVQDMEPEYVTIEGTTAYVSAQENNAIVEVNLVTKTITAIKTAGLKDWESGSLVVDTSDKDGAIEPGPRAFKGLRMPDGMDSYTVDGETYVVMANEGDGRVRPDDVNLEVSSDTHLSGAGEGWIALVSGAPADALETLTDPLTGDQISVVAATGDGDPADYLFYEETEDGEEYFITAQYGFQADDDFSSDEERLYKYDDLTSLSTWMQTNGADKESLIGRLKTVSTETDTTVPPDGNPDQVIGFGGRSFSIMKVSDGSIVYDSGDATEQAAIAAGIYDDGRSDDKGTEPEGVTLATVGDKTYAFVALERVNAVHVFDVTSPTDVSEVQLINVEAASGGKGPECVVTNTADDLVIVASESGTKGLAFYSLSSATTVPAPVEEAEDEPAAADDDAVPGKTSAASSAIASLFAMATAAAGVLL
jgi:hypothetical protein